MSDNKNLETVQEETTETVVAAEEMEQAEKTGVVVFEDKKKAASQSANYTHTFKKPREIMGKKYNTMTFYFENLTGDDMEAVEEELAANNQFVLAPEVNSAFQARLAARAAGVASDEICRLPLGDYMKIKNKARDFLIAAGY